MAKRNNDNDLIRRGDVRDALKKMAKPLVGCGVSTFAVDYPVAVDSVPTFNPWISVNERPPELGKRVLCCSNSGFVGEGWLMSGGYFVRHYGERFALLGMTITHWMPLPESPKGGKNEHIDT